jgi:hypothetical protein
LKKVENYEVQLHYQADMESALAVLNGDEADLFMILLDNKLGPGEDFRRNLPLIRKTGFTGPVGVISSSLTDPYFQSFEEYGADFRIDKAEFDPTAVEFIIREYMDKKEPPM